MNGLQETSKAWEHALRKDQRCYDDGFFTYSSIEQKRVEGAVAKNYETALATDMTSPPLDTVFHKDQHAIYLRKSLVELPDQYGSLDASRPWLCYWALHSLELLGEPIPTQVCSNIITFLATCQASSGGYGGGPGQNAHLATTYAAVMALAIIGTQEAFESIDREKLYHFFKSVKRPDGSFTMEQEGEVDIRGVYCAAAVASLVSLPLNPLFTLTPEWLSSCQTYEGGFGAEPGAEAHGGYAFCGLAGLILLGHEGLCDLDGLARWLAWKQTKFEGGFQGRTNKLVDSCYSYWVGGTWALVQKLLGKKGVLKSPLFAPEPLQHYLLVCCQNSNGGFFDKPGKGRDLYHTCYALSGLSQVWEGLEPNHDLLNISMKAETIARKYFAKAKTISAN